MAQSVAPEQFVGTWRLVRMRADMGEGTPEEPYGPEPLGYITYTADGYMHAILMHPDRPSGGTPLEEATAYSATWEVRGAEVVHHVTTSVLPAWIGTDLVRTYRFDDDRMTLTAHFPGDRSIELVWQKA